MIAIVDTGGANLKSVVNALERLGASHCLTSNPVQIAGADQVILPGVGAAREAMRRLDAAQLIPVLRNLKQPVLGICLGMQLLFESSEEGDVACLGLIPGRVVRLKDDPLARVPHMGWNHLQRRDSAEPLLAAIQDDDCFYFVHSFRAPDGPWVKAVTEHGELLPAVVSYGNVKGVQFHPEKSQGPGARLLSNFVRSTVLC
ncbi:MAG: imidazole glycerol phosphate synthase subunit HisH [Deltaproteobacteria bacterium]|nr:imidazole glycerol phosphate synthase subunit HisH [Deltaproteobacteria bacterium]